MVYLSSAGLPRLSWKKAVISEKWHVCHLMYVVTAWCGCRCLAQCSWLQSDAANCSTAPVNHTSSPSTQNSK